jgi:putative peptidoglycan lipid II flippase
MGLVATAVLNARDQFVLPVAAPIVNNVVVVAAYLVFDSMRGEAGPSLDLSPAEIAVLAGGTTLAVIAFTLVPVVAVVRSGVSLWPRFDRTHPAVRRIARDGAWAAAWLAGTQVLLGVVLVLANGVEGGVVVWQVALTFFLLPHALFALPVITALFPRMSRDAGGSPAGAGPAVRQGIRAISLLTLPAAAVLAVLGGAAAQLVLVGEGEAAAGDVGRAAAAFAIGLPAYGVFLFLTRAFHAAGDARTPALVSWGLAGGGAIALILAAALAAEGDRITALAAAYSASYVIAAITLAVMFRARVLGAHGLQGVAGALTRYGAMAVAAGGAMAAVRQLVPDPDGRFELAVGELAAPALAGVAVLALFDSLMGGDGRRALQTARGSSRG